MFPWRANSLGPRSLDDAIDLARKHGVDIPEDIVFVVDDDLVKKGAQAQYTFLYCESGEME